MSELKPCPYTDAKVSLKLRTFAPFIEVPGLYQLVMWAADIIDRRAEPAESLACLGCGYEHNCGTSGCAILQAAIDYFEDAIRESDEIISDCSLDLQAELTKQKRYFQVALDALHLAERPNGPLKTENPETQWKSQFMNRFKQIN